MNKATDMTKKTTRTRAEAKKLMWEYYSENKASLPTWIRECREEILERLMAGDGVVETFDSVTDSEVTSTDTQDSSTQAAA